MTALSTETQRENQDTRLISLSALQPLSGGCVLKQSKLMVFLRQGMCSRFRAAVC